MDRDDGCIVVMICGLSTPDGLKSLGALRLPRDRHEHLCQTVGICQAAMMDHDDGCIVSEFSSLDNSKSCRSSTIPC